MYVIMLSSIKAEHGRIIIFYISTFRYKEEKKMREY